MHLQQSHKKFASTLGGGGLSLRVTTKRGITLQLSCTGGIIFNRKDKSLETVNLHESLHQQ